MRVLFLYAEIMGYNVATIRALVARGAEVHVVHWQKGKLTPYRAPELAGVIFYDRAGFTMAGLQQLARTVSPSLVVVSGWMDKGYLPVARRLRTLGVPVVVAFDDQWHGTPRQFAASLLASCGCLSLIFSHAWVAGSWQFEYARRLGFAKKNIIYDLYSADVPLFDAAFAASLTAKQSHYPHRFLFVGRLEPVKGLPVLVAAWKRLGEARRDWDLRLIGDGGLKETLIGEPSLVLKDFAPPDELIEEVANAGCLVLPSMSEPWGVVVHEFAAAGLPLILSDVVGAASSFLIPGVNGFRCTTGDEKALTRRMLQIIHLSDTQLLAMSKASNRLSHRITPDSSAANLLSLNN